MSDRPRFGLSYKIGRQTSSLTHMDAPGEVKVDIDGRSFRIIVEGNRITVETSDFRSAIIPERELLGVFETRKA